MRSTWSQLRADCVEKVENQETAKIAQMPRVGGFSRCKAS
jgi:hypothetical protein